MIKLSCLLKIALLAIEQAEEFTAADSKIIDALSDILMTMNTGQDRIIYDIGKFKEMKFNETED